MIKNFIIFFILNFLCFLNVSAFELGKTPLVSTWENNLKKIIIETQDDFNDYLEKTWIDFSWDSVYFRNNEKIIFPENVYFTNKPVNWYFEWWYSWDFEMWNSIFAIWDWWNIVLRFIWDQKNRKISWWNFYASTRIISIDDEWTIKWFRNNTYFHILKWENIVFENITFNNSQAYDSHIFDIQWWNNVKILNSNFLWYWWVEEFSEKQLSILTEKNPHLLYSEAIQIDYASFSWAWTKKEQFILDKENNLDKVAIYELEMFDNTSSKNILIDGNKFLPYVWFSWNAIIKGNSEIIKRWYSAWVWSHAYSGIDNYENIVIINNIFQNTIKFDKNYLWNISELIFAAVHIREKKLNENKKNFIVENNKFIDTDFETNFKDWEVDKNQYMWFFWDSEEYRNTFYKITDEIISEIDYDTEYIYDENLNFWEKKILEKGENWIFSNIFWFLKNSKNEKILISSKKETEKKYWSSVSKRALYIKNDDRVRLKFFDFVRN